MSEQNTIEICKLFAKKLKDGYVYEKAERTETELETVRYWNAKILGKDSKYGVKRSFLDKKIFVEEFEDGEIIENVTGSARWREHNFYVVKDGKFVKFADGDKDMNGRQIIW